MVEFFVRRHPLPPSHVRIVASAIVRKWLIDNQLTQLARETGCNFTLPVLNTEVIASAIAAGASIRFFMAGGIMMDGTPIKGYYASDEPFSGTPQVPITSMDYVDVSPSKFLSSKRIYFDGTWFTTEHVIRFMANKFGGVHFDKRRTEPWQTKLEAASGFFTVGNPNNLTERQLIETTSPKHNIHLVLPKEVGHLWTCLDVELLAIAQSLGNIACNGARLFVFAEPTRRRWLRTFWNRITSYLRRLAYDLK